MSLVFVESTNLEDMPVSAPPAVNRILSKMSLHSDDMSVGESSPDTGSKEPFTLLADIAAGSGDAVRLQPWCGEYEMVKMVRTAPRVKGVVQKMSCFDDGGFVLVKKIPTHWMKTNPTVFEQENPKFVENPWLDIALLSCMNSLNFRNVCELLGVFTDGQHSYIVSAFDNGADLFSIMDKLPLVGPAREIKVRAIAKKAFSAVRRLHDLGIGHCDVSLETLVLSRDRCGHDGDGYSLKLTDFEMATLDRYRCRGIGRRSYAAPELHKGAEHVDAFLVDAFALGVVVLTLATQAYPWNSTKLGECRLFDCAYYDGLQCYMKRRKIRKTQWSWAEAISEELKEVIAGLCSFDAESRTMLGERAWASIGSGVVSRQSVWEARWLL